MKKRHLRKSIEVALWGILFIIFLMIGSMVDVELSGIPIVICMIIVMILIACVLYEYGSIDKDGDEF